MSLKIWDLVQTLKQAAEDIDDAYWSSDCVKRMREAINNEGDALKRAHEAEKENEKLRAENTKLLNRLLMCEPTLDFKDFVKDMEMSKNNKEFWDSIDK